MGVSENYQMLEMYFQVTITLDGYDCKLAVTTIFYGNC